jgi:hypothetical protein
MDGRSLNLALGFLVKLMKLSGKSIFILTDRPENATLPPAMKEIKVKIKSVYGSDKMYPACPDSQMFCDIAGTKILTESLQNILAKRGWKIMPTL